MCTALRLRRACAINSSLAASSRVRWLIYFGLCRSWVIPNSSYTHHQKSVVVDYRSKDVVVRATTAFFPFFTWIGLIGFFARRDGVQAFVGGLHLTWGRWDTSDHSITTIGRPSSGPARTTGTMEMRIHMWIALRGLTAIWWMCCRNQVSLVM
jgi:hypothetical protein